MIFKKSQKFREEMYLTLLANSSMCLMKLQQYDKAKMLLERMFRLGENRLKLYLRLAKCLEHEKNYAESYQVLDKRALRALQREKDAQLKKTYTKMKARILRLLKKEESKQDELFRKCYNLKKKENTSQVTLASGKLSNNGTPAGGSELSVVPLWKKALEVGLRWLGAITVGAASSYLLMRFNGAESLSREIFLGNTTLFLYLTESFRRNEKIKFGIDMLGVLVINAFWIRHCYKRGNF